MENEKKLYDFSFILMVSFFFSCSLTFLLFPLESYTESFVFHIAVLLIEHSIFFSFLVLTKWELKAPDTRLSQCSTTDQRISAQGESILSGTNCWELFYTTNLFLFYFMRHIFFIAEGYVESSSKGMTFDSPGVSIIWPA